jgi:hypothetical protein
MNRVAAEVAQEIGVPLERENLNTCPQEQKREHHTGGSAARDAATGENRFYGHRLFPEQLLNIPSTFRMISVLRF